MGFLDGLKNKISESGYADKVSAGLNTIGKGLQSGSEKLQSFASSLNDSNQHVIEDDVEIIDTQVPAIQENTSVLAESNVENNVSPVIQREMFSVNENDSNETRQIKEVLQDANSVVQSVNEVVNSEAVVNFSVAVKESINLISEYNKREQIINAKLQMIDKQNQHSLDTMDKQYEQIKPLINELLAQIQTHRKNLETFDPKSMNEKDYNAYFMLSQQLDNCNSRIMQIYDKITG